MTSSIYITFDYLLEYTFPNSCSAYKAKYENIKSIWDLEKPKIWPNIQQAQDTFFLFLSEHDMKNNSISFLEKKLKH